MKKILCFKLKSVCYDSYSFFMDSISFELQKRNYELSFFDINSEPLENLERLIDQHYDAMFDFNSDLPKLKMDDDTYFLDHIHAPFYDIILDHPLYHHDMLKQTLHNFHVLCLDHAHLSYIKTYYSHILSVNVCFMTGQTHLPFVPYEKRSNDLLFTGTYTASLDVWNAISNTPPFLADDTKTLIEFMLDNESMTIEQAVTELSTHSDHILKESFPLHVQSHFLADTYVRSYQREQLLAHLIQEGLPITICGYGWDAFSLSNLPNVTLLKSVPFAETFSLMGNSKMVLNLMPNFKNGTHDRIFSSMLNKCVTLTNESLYLKDHFVSKKDLIFYQLSHLSGLIDTLHKLKENEELAMQIANAGFENASLHYTWKNFVDLLDKNVL